MGKPRFPCKNHPEKLSARKCYLCKQYICSDCQIRFAHHFFCGIWCIIKLSISNYLNIFISPFKSKRFNDIILIVTILLIVQIILFLIVHFKINDITAKMDKINSENVIPEFASLDSTQLAFTLDTTFSPVSNFINISGTSFNNSVVGLWHNGKFVQSNIIENGFYKFLPQALFLGKNKFAVWNLIENRASLLDSFTIDYHSYRMAILAKSVYRIVTDSKVLAITFDAGSHAFGADSIINILNSKGIKNTFFLTGHFIKKYPLIIKKLIKNGHELANHTYSHPHLTSLEKNGLQQTLPKVNRWYVYNQLNKTDSILYNNYNIHLKPYWRAPFGELNNEILSWAAEIGYRHIFWSSGCDTWDWVEDKDSELYRTPEEIYNHLMQLELKGKLNGSIILMHLGSDRKSEFPFSILAKFIESLIGKGYKFMTISQLLRLNLK